MTELLQYSVLEQAELAGDVLQEGLSKGHLLAMVELANILSLSKLTYLYTTLSIYLAIYLLSVYS